MTHLNKYIAVKDRIANIKYFIMWKGKVPENLDKDFQGRVMTWDQFMDIGKKQYKPARK